MALLNVEKRIVSRFICRTPQSASPADKGASRRLDNIVGTPHCLVELTIGTRGSFVDRTSVSGTYDLHVPDAPLLTESSAVYAAGAAQTAFGPRRLASNVLSCLLGAALAVAVVAAAAGFIALVHLALPALAGAAVAGPVIPLTALTAAVAGLLCGYLDHQQWSDAHHQFSTLHLMTEIGNRLRAGQALAGDEAWAAHACDTFLRGEDWVLSQAALELEAKCAVGKERAAV